MDGNRDEADRCLEIGKRAFLEGKFDKAEKFIQKAERLFPSSASKDLLAKVKIASANNESRNSDSENVKHRKASPVSSRKPNEEERMEPEYTSEQLEAVKAVKKCKDYYEILGVNKEATDNDIKRQYKKLALQLHPDKNKAPGASEAFKAIGNAVAVLTDPEKRKQYDAFGADDERVQHRGAHAHARHYSYTRGFESDFTAEELFNMFFGSSGAHVYRWRPHAPREAPAAREPPGSYAGLLQMLPILGLILLSTMSTFFISDPVYSLSPSHKFPVQRKTEQLQVPYYVKENFYSEYQGSLRRLEVTVQEEYVSNLRHACYRERNYRDSMTWKAKNFGDKQQFQTAQNMKMPSCEALHNLQR